MTQREEFEAWLDRVTRHPDSTMPTPWQTWQAAQLSAMVLFEKMLAAQAAQPSQAGLSDTEVDTQVEATIGSRYWAWSADWQDNFRKVYRAAISAKGQP